MKEKKTTRNRCVLLNSVLLSLLVTGHLVGCAGYRFGSASLFPTEVRTVYVPVFRSDSFRRHLAERLTEAVVKELERRTPYKVVVDDVADSVLSGKIVSTRKRVLAEDINDNPRDIEVSMKVEATWHDHRSNLMMQTVVLPIPALSLAVGNGTAFVPEGGQSIATAQQDSIEDIATQIVSQMESTW